ncbi:uncharacterized protein PV07_08025 [Cladophialophora immunda]|uniref:Uncharacterized protein n=1 Tax=Cladophialophora immunda TaxID=569365 RepID=A0A0D2CBC4_9EURO|nr:uncharacterized protein PV07_08025 [Cladophialophora immunda]KIW28353.1 hypothetical protein PV07_08025 [Cladophialophora immunda]
MIDGDPGTRALGPVEELALDSLVISIGHHSAKEPLDARKDLAVHDVGVHCHVAQVVENFRRLRHVLLARNTVILLPGECRPPHMFEALVKVFLPEVKRFRQRCPPAIRDAHCLRYAEAGHLEVTLVHVPRNRQKTGHKGHSAKVVRANLAAGQSLFESVQKCGRFDPVGMQTSFDSSNFCGRSGGPQGVIARERQSDFMNHHHRRVAEHGRVKCVQIECGVSGTTGRFCCDPADPPFFGRRRHTGGVLVCRLDQSRSSSHQVDGGGIMNVRSLMQHSRRVHFLVNLQQQERLKDPQLGWRMEVTVHKNLPT